VRRGARPLAHNTREFERAALTAGHPGWNRCSECRQVSAWLSPGITPEPDPRTRLGAARTLHKKPGFHKSELQKTWAGGCYIGAPFCPKLMAPSFHWAAADDKDVHVDGVPGPPGAEKMGLDDSRGFGSNHSGSD
jgi:hypothetical protein